MGWPLLPYFLLFCESGNVCMYSPHGLSQTVLKTKFSCQIIRVIVATGIQCRLTEASLKSFAQFCASTFKYGRVVVHLFDKFLLWNEISTLAFELGKHMFVHNLLGSR